MTAINLFTHGDTANLLIDRGLYHDDGRVLRFGTKYVTSKRLRIVVGSNGCAIGHQHHYLVQWLGRATSQAGALLALPLLVEELQVQLDDCDNRSGYDDPFVQLHIAAYLEAQQQPALFVIGSKQGRFGDTYVPGTLRRVSSIMSPPVPEPLHPTYPGFQLLRGCQLIADCQRSTSDDEGLHRTAGAMELVTVNRSGIRSRIVRRWPDQVGQPVSIART